MHVDDPLDRAMDGVIWFMVLPIERAHGRGWLVAPIAVAIELPWIVIMGLPCIVALFGLLILAITRDVAEGR